MSQEYGIIMLAGGKSSRMGTDKGLIKVNGIPLIQYLLDRLMKVHKNIYIVANNLAYEQFGFPTYPDLISDVGPIGGLYTGLCLSPFEKNIILSCDTPNVSLKTIQELLNESKKDTNVVAKTTKLHPLIAVYHKKSIPVIKTCIDQGNYRLSKLLSLINSKEIDFTGEDEKEFINLNTQRDLNNFINQQ